MGIDRMNSLSRLLMKKIFGAEKTSYKPASDTIIGTDTLRRPNRRPEPTAKVDKTIFKTMGNSLNNTLVSACDWLIGQQKPDGHWVGAVESNASMEAEWCLALWFLGLEDHPLRPRLGNALWKCSGKMALGGSILALEMAISMPRLKPMRLCGLWGILPTILF